MITQGKPKSVRKPRIAIPQEDIERLSRLAAAATRVMPDVAEYLEHELERARAIPAGRSAAHVVKMGARAEYRDEKTGNVHTVTLVYPGDSDIERGLVSVLTPIGAALLGLSEGQSIEWTTRTGERRQLTVLAIGNGVPAQHDRL